MPRSSSGVIAIATMKGGSGKTTLAVCLAARWMQLGRHTALVDADPQRSALRWVGAGEELSALKVTALDSAQTGAAEMIRSLVEQGYERIVVDTPGFRSPTTAAILTLAHMALVPIKPSPVDFEVAADTMDMIGEIARARADPGSLKTRFVLCQTILRSVMARHMRQELQDARYPLLHAELTNRVAHTEAPFTGSTPSLIAPEGAAAREIEAVRAEIDALLDGSE
ncbi:MAG: ParA family protein [Myxococcota bacterium]